MGAVFRFFLFSLVIGLFFVPSAKPVAKPVFGQDKPDVAEQFCKAVLTSFEKAYLHKPFQVFAEEDIEGLVAYLEEHPDLAGAYIEFTTEDLQKSFPNGFAFFFTPTLIYHPEYVERLLLAGYSPNTAYRNSSWTILHEAIATQNVDSARLLIEYGADINAFTTEDSSLTPLHVAAFSRNIELVELLIAQGADINITGGGYGSPPIMFADDVSMARLFIKHGADIHAVNDDGASLLHVFSFKPQLVEFYIKQGVSPYIKDKDGDTALDTFKEYYERTRCDCEKDKDVLQIIHTLEQAMQAQKIE